MLKNDFTCVKKKDMNIKAGFIPFD